MTLLTRTWKRFLNLGSKSCDSFYQTLTNFMGFWPWRI